MTHASTPNAPTNIPGKKPARKTPGGNGLLDDDRGGLVESRLDVDAGDVFDVDVALEIDLDAVADPLADVVDAKVGVEAVAEDVEELGCWVIALFATI